MAETKICARCDAEFSRPETDSNGAWANRRYCGFVCRAMAQAEHNHRSYLVKAAARAKRKTETKRDACAYYPRIEINSPECQAEGKLSCPNCRILGRGSNGFTRPSGWERQGEAF